jgi:uncharacterized membrane protein (DUF373 family)
MEKKGYVLNVKFLRQLIIAADDIIHFVVALTLMACAAVIIIRTLPNFFHGGTLSTLHVVNDVLLSLIVMELMWPIVRFLKRKPFSLNPFLYIGIISSTRRLLMIEAEHSTISALGQQKIEWQDTWPVLAELGINVTIILVLAISLRLICNTGKQESEI